MLHGLLRKPVDKKQVTAEFWVRQHHNDGVMEINQLRNKVLSYVLSNGRFMSNKVSVDG